MPYLFACELCGDSIAPNTVLCGICREETKKQRRDSQERCSAKMSRVAQPVSNPIKY